MSILYIRGEDGQFQHVESLQGQPGKDGDVPVAYYATKSDYLSAPEEEKQGKLCLWGDG